MNNVEIDDVYHHDFTTASEWEVFIARLEEIIHEWKLSHTKLGAPLKAGDFTKFSWQENTERLNFADFEFYLKHYKLKIEDDDSQLNNTTLEEPEDTWTQCQKDILNAANDFVQLNQPHLEIARYYGIREFILLVPAKQSSITDETRIKILLSSLTIAVSNAHCEIAAFVQVQEQWQNFYLGINIGKGSRMHLNMVHLKKIPPHCKHLTGLLNVFKQKISEGCGGLRLDPVVVSVRLSYSLKDWTSSTWTQEPPDFDFLQGETLGVDELGKLPFGATFDPIKEFRLFVTWPEICENVVVDSESFSDLEPLSAPRWSLQVEMVPMPACLLGEYLTNFLQLCNNSKSLVELLGEGAAYIDNENQSLSSAFNILTESRIPSITSVVSKTASKSRKNVDGPITEDVLLPILYFLFPDAEENPRAPYDSNGSNVDEDQWRGIKTCAIDSLVWRLAVVAAHCAFNLGGVNALAQLWHEFVQEIRFRWEKCIPLPGVGPGFPDCVRTCLLHQKLQMINCCIARKKAREECEKKEQNSIYEAAQSSGEDTEEEDEFFECLNEEAEVRKQQQQLQHQHLPWNRPVGRLAKHPTLRLIHTGEPLYLPITQDPVPKTEDQLEEDAQVMMQLGTDKTASEMRARLMSASLLSDMESFKAANPCGQLEDFIRWYSPRDWIEEEGLDEWGQQKGHISARMMLENNPWSSTWESAQPVPAHRQKRLFDDTREAEKVLHYLACQRVGQIGQLLLPVLAHAALVTLHTQAGQKLGLLVQALPALSDVVQAVNNRIQFATKPIQQKLQIYADIIRDIENIESLIAQLNSLQLKLSDGNGDEELSSFLVQLMRDNEVPVPSGPRGAIGGRIVKMFSDAQKAAHMMTSSTGDGEIPFDAKFKPFPEPTTKEFILRAMAPRPSAASTLQPQRLFVSLHRDGIRMTGAFSEDTIFF